MSNPYRTTTHVGVREASDGDGHETPSLLAPLLVSWTASVVRVGIAVAKDEGFALEPTLALALTLVLPALVARRAWGRAKAYFKGAWWLGRAGALAGERRRSRP